MSRLRAYVAPLLLIAALIGLWEIAAQWDLISNALNIQDYFVPAPSDVARSLWEDRSLLASDACRRTTIVFHDAANDIVREGLRLGERNVAAARRLLAAAGIAVVAEDVGGSRGRKLVFHTDDGVALVRTL